MNLKSLRRHFSKHVYWWNPPFSMYLDSCLVESSWHGNLVPSSGKPLVPSIICYHHASWCCSSRLFPQGVMFLDKRWQLLQLEWTNFFEEESIFKHVHDWTPHHCQIADQSFKRWKVLKTHHNIHPWDVISFYPFVFNLWDLVHFVVVTMPWPWVPNTWGFKELEVKFREMDHRGHAKNTTICLN